MFICFVVALSQQSGKRKGRPNGQPWGREPRPEQTRSVVLFFAKGPLAQQQKLWNLQSMAWTKGFPGERWDRHRDKTRHEEGPGDWHVCGWVGGVCVRVVYNNKLTQSRDVPLGLLYLFPVASSNQIVWKEMPRFMAWTTWHLQGLGFSVQEIYGGKTPSEIKKLFPFQIESNAWTSWKHFGIICWRFYVQAIVMKLGPTHFEKKV